MQFDLLSLPIKLNLPMICPPSDWTFNLTDDKTYPTSLSDLNGDYLS